MKTTKTVHAQQARLIRRYVNTLINIVVVETLAISVVGFVVTAWILLVI